MSHTAVPGALRSSGIPLDIFASLPEAPAALLSGSLKMTACILRTDCGHAQHWRSNRRRNERHGQSLMLSLHVGDFLATA